MLQKHYTFQNATCSQSVSLLQNREMFKTRHAPKVAFSPKHTVKFFYLKKESSINEGFLLIKGLMIKLLLLNWRLEYLRCFFNSMWIKSIWTVKKDNFADLAQTWHLLSVMGQIKGWNLFYQIFTFLSVWIRRYPLYICYRMVIEQQLKKNTIMFGSFYQNLISQI